MQKPFKVLSAISLKEACLTVCRVWHSKAYRYIGGFYGGGNEALMQEELRRNGPIAVSIRVCEV